MPKVSDDPGALWSVTHAPAANTVAIASKAAAAGQRHICTGISARINGGTTAPAAVIVTVHLRDGASGVGTPLMSFTLVLAAAIAAIDNINLIDLEVPGTIGNAMTLEFTAAGGLNTLESVTLVGYTIR